MGQEGTERFKDDSHFWLEQRGSWWPGSLKEVAFEEQGFGEHGEFIMDDTDFMALRGHSQMVTGYKGLELRREMAIISERMATGRT